MVILEWSRESTKNLGFLFSYDLERNFYRNFLVETYNSLVGTNFLHVLHYDCLAVDFEAELSELVSDVEGVYRAIDSAGGANLRGDLQRFNSTQLGSEFFSIGLNLGELVGTLLEVLSQHFLCRFRGNHGLTRGDKVVTAVAVLYVYDVVLIAKAGYVCFQNDGQSLLAALSSASKR